MRIRLLTTVVVLAAASGGATRCGEIIRDPGFDLWCGDQLCTWQLEKGDVRRVATWHQGDSGVEMVGDDVSISQLTPVESSDGTCVFFELVADVAEDAEVRLLMDVYGDGTVEYDERIPTSDWRRLTYLVRMPSLYEGVRFRLTKRGAGRAVLANIGAEIAADQSCTAPALQVIRPDGAVCEGGDECSSGFCYPWPGAWPDVCGQCEVDADCGADLCVVTGPSPGHLSVSSRCLPPNSLANGLRCLRDQTCESGLCVDGVCGECRTDGDCGGASCRPASGSRPATCAAGRGPGAPCFDGSDCDSGTCSGAPLRGCDGSLDRECVTAADCPGYLTDPDMTYCDVVGVRGGTCQ